MSRLTELARGNATGGVALLILFVACGTIAGAWTIEAMGYIPCELCLLGRKPYYIGIALAALTVFAAWGGRAQLARWGLLCLALTFSAGRRNRRLSLRRRIPPLAGANRVLGRIDGRNFS